MNTNYIKYFLLVICFYLTACKDDIVGYDALNTNVVNIEISDTAPVAFYLENFQLKVKLQTEANQSYIYQWKVYQSSGFSKVISTDKDLNVKVDIPVGTYDLEYRITNTATGVQSFELIQLTVSGKYSNGWIVTNNHNGNAEITFIRADGEIFRDIIKAENGQSISEVPLATFTAAREGLSLSYLFTKKGIYRMGAEDFFINGKTKDILEIPLNNYSSVTYGLNGYGTEQFIIADGGLFIGIGQTFYKDQVLSPFTQRITGDYDLYPAVINSSRYFGYFYDNKFKRFLNVQLLTTALQPVESTIKENDNYNLAHVNKTMIGCDLGPEIDYYNNEVYMIMADQDDRFLYSIKSTSPGRAQQINRSPEIQNAKFFATSRVLPHMYYATDQAIYLYDIEQNASRLLYTFTAGLHIADMKMLRDDHSSMESKRLVVATNRNSKGEVYYFEINQLGEFSNKTFSKKFTDFGTITSLTLK